MANEYLQRIPTSTGNRKVVTISAWYKNNKVVSGGHTIFSSGMNPTSPDGRNQIDLVTNSNPLWQFEQYGFPTAGGNIANYYARDVDRKFRDFSSWSHIMVSFDSTKPRPQDRSILYHNGVRFDKDSGSSNFPQNFELPIGVLTNNLGIKIGNGVGALQYGNTYFNGQLMDYFFVDGQALEPDVFGFYKDGDGYMSSGTANATDFKPGQWMPHAPRVIKKSIERSGGFGANGFYLPMNDSSNPGADFHCTPNSIIKLKGEDLPQPQNGAPTTTDAYVSQLRQETGTLGFDGAVKFDGAGDYLSLSTTSDFAFGTGDFTVEFWAWIESSQSSTLQPIFDNDYNSAGGIAIAIRHSDSRIFVGDNGSGLNLCQFNAPFALNSWNHFAVVADGGTYKAFVNGVACSLAAGSTTVVNTSKSSGTTEIGRLVGQTGIDAQCFISNLRVVKGTAVYTTNYTAPTEPLTNVTNTKLLCCNSTKAPESATVAPAIGTYVQNWTENTSSGLDSYNGIGAIYDGQLGTSNRGGNSSSHDGSYETLFDGQSVAVSSTIEIYWNGVGSGQRVIRVNGTTEINGGSGALTPGWDSHSFSGTVTKLEVKTANTGSYGISAVRIDSNILTTPLTSNGDVFATKNELTGSIVLTVPGIALENTNPELVTNGDFSNGTTGWTGLSGASLSVEGNRLKITETTSALDAYAVNSSAITTEVGKRYTIKWTFHEGTNTTFTVRFGNSGNQTQAYLSNSDSQGQFSDPGTYSFDFEATGTQLNLSFIVNQADSFGYISNVSVKEAMPVRDYSADIRGSGSNKTLTANGSAGVGYELGNYYGSAMTFPGTYNHNISLGANTDFAFGTGDFTVEMWFYTNQTARQRILSSTQGGFVSTTWVLRLEPGNILTQYTANAITGVYAAPNQWHHVAVEREGTITSLYLNGICVGIDSNDNKNYTEAGSNNFWLSSGYSVDTATENFDGYIQDLRIYKGLAKYKGGFDVPKPYTPVGIEEFRTIDDTCKNNFCTWNPLDKEPSVVFSNGNLSYIRSAGWGGTGGTHGLAGGKYYWELMIDSSSANNFLHAGIADGARVQSNISSGFAGSVLYFSETNVVKVDNGSDIATGLSLGIGDILQMAYDATTRSFYVGVNGTFANSGNPIATATAGYDFVPIAQSATTPSTANFGQNPSFCGQTTAGTNTDGNGKGLFKYAPPSGFLALCEDNLPTPAIADPGDHFKCVLYSGDNSAGRRISDVGFQPDMVWIKARNATPSHILTDSVRGIGHQLSPDDVGAEVDSGTFYLTSFADNGFDLGDGANSGGNTTGRNYVAWCWKGGGAAVTNTDGSITSQVSANQTAGFSIVSYTGTATVGTIGHGLGKRPKVVIVKRRDASTHWTTWFDGVSTNTAKVMSLDLNTAEADFAAAFNSSDTTTTTFPVGTGGGQTNASGSGHIAYCWAEIEGYSKFGSYEGNGDADGPFVYCGFKPAFIITKWVDGAAAWVMHDSSRTPTNPSTLALFPDTGGVELDASSLSVDFLSNGFKIRNTNASYNNTSTYIFMAFAESPFQTANAK